MKLRHREIARQAKEGADSLTWIVANASDIERRANADGYAGFGPGITGRHAGVSDPTAAAALSPRDRRAELAASLFRDALYEANRAATRAERIGRSLLALDEKTARKLVHETPDASGICANPACKVTVLNLPNDRLREGRCSACYQWRRNHHGNERPRDLCHPVVCVE